MGKGNAQAKVELGLNFWCMNPAIGFADLEIARSVIVTSGTLSPMTSFQSELGAKFPHSLSTDHVISPSQVI
jgi:fanconi anemia group J protein